ncbi:restriction endonuclease subunit S [uncultured Mailhella sp.]|uniref:restriction endonuclease subunit S n=1 Tax=uncultured Mailhella sp. TaxID=1981031 RepID=UPI0025D9BDCB|nr:restriction endonuclease subunit S [uncultured Mailhella sp.]
MIKELNPSIPSLRFPHFKGKMWNKDLLQNIAAPITDKADSSCTDHVLTLSCEYGLIIQQNYFEKNIASLNLSRYVKIQNNDFVYNDRVTNLYPYGTIKRNTLNIRGLVSPIYKCFRFSTKTEPAFWQYYFEAHCHEHELKNIINEGARAGRFNISIKQFLKIPVFLPDKAEQKKIADCLSSLDELIEAHEQKLDALKQHKKGLMQRLFPAEGETTPRWRFPEFKNAIEWRKKSLGAICHLQAGKFIDSTKIFPIWHKGLFPCYGGNGLRGYVEKSNYKTCYPIIGRQGALCGNVKMPTGEFYATEHAIVAECNNDSISNIFLFYFLSKLNINRLAIGQAQPGISIEIVKKISIKLPDIHEQQKIADCLISIDEQIEAQEEKIKALKEHKKGMMQQLFPSL